MNEIKETLAILKRRWPEAALIIGLGFLPNLLIHIFSYYHAPKIMRTLSIVRMFLFLVIIIFTAGFLRTIYLEQNKRQSFADLFRVGKHFFLRLLVFGILCALPMMLFVWLLITTTNNMGLNTTFSLAHRIGSTFIQLILAKLTLLIPAIIIVLDCSLSKSFGFMWKVKLLKARPLLIIFLIQIIALPCLAILLSGLLGARPDISISYVFTILYSLTLHTLVLMVQLMAVRFVISLGIECNELYKPPESFILSSIF